MHNVHAWIFLPTPIVRVGWGSLNKVLFVLFVGFSFYTRWQNELNNSFYQEHGSNPIFQSRKRRKWYEGKSRLFSSIPVKFCITSVHRKDKQWQRSTIKATSSTATLCRSSVQKIRHVDGKQLAVASWQLQSTFFPIDPHFLKCMETREVFERD